jgi:histone H1/5
MVLFLAVTARHQTVAQKIKNFLTKWRDVQKRIPLPEMTELLITPQLPEYPKIARDVFMLLLDGKLRSHTETLKFLKPFAPPPPPPPPPPRRGRGPKAAAVVAPTEAAPGKKGDVAKGKGKAKDKAAAVAAPQMAAPVAKPEAKAKPEVKAKPQVKAKPEARSKPAKASTPKPAKHPTKPAAKHPAKKAAPKKVKTKKVKARKR